ncbi:MAG: septum formation initiator family protein [Bacteroidales bacterium]|nr:septum formation initiator family protein [Bacteroidales bacterium]
MAKKKKTPKPFLRFVIIATALAVAFLFVKRDNIFRWLQAGFTIRRQQKQIEFYQEDNERLDRQIRMMSTNRDTLEKFAREQFNFASPGDDVYVIEK